MSENRGALSTPPYLREKYKSTTKESVGKDSRFKAIGAPMLFPRYPTGTSHRNISNLIGGNHQDGHQQAWYKHFTRQLSKMKFNIRDVLKATS